jgi:hypothetical protein
VHLEHLEPNGVGSFLLGALNVPLSAAPLQAPHVVLRGSPALVVGVVERNGKTWRRLLGADGSMGWVEGALAEVPGQLSVTRDTELTDRIAAANAALDELQTTPIPGGSAADVLEASDAAYPETMSQLGTQNYLDSDWLPWLRVRVGAAEGWLAPSDAKMAWAAASYGQCFSWRGFGGLVRASFLFGAHDALAAAAPRAGESVRHVVRAEAEPWPVGATCSMPHAAFFDKSDAPPGAVLFQCSHPRAGKIQVLASAERKFFVIDQGRKTRIVRAESVRLAGSPQTLILELALQSSHADEHVLFAPSLASDTGPGDLVPLGADDSTATWNADNAAGTLTIVRASRRAVDTDILTLNAGRLATSRGFTAALSVHATLLSAERAVLLDPGSYLIGLSYPTTSWAKARSYPTQAEACQQLRASNVPTPVMRVKPNLSCVGTAFTGGKR